MGVTATKLDNVKVVVRYVTPVGEETRELETLTAVIGRGKAADLAYSHDELSRKHFSVELIEGRLYATDLNSSNGTFVNKMKIAPGTPVELKAGFKVSFSVSHDYYYMFDVVEDEKTVNLMRPAPDFNNSIVEQSLTIPESDPAEAYDFSVAIDNSELPPIPDVDNVIPMRNSREEGAELQGELNTLLQKVEQEQLKYEKYRTLNAELLTKHNSLLEKVEQLEQALRAKQDSFGEADNTPNGLNSLTDDDSESTEVIRILGDKSILQKEINSLTLELNSILEKIELSGGVYKIISQS